MLVQDLVYLLQTRAEPEQELYLCFRKILADKSIEQYTIECELGFDAVVVGRQGPECAIDCFIYLNGQVDSDLQRIYQSDTEVEPG